MPPQGASLPLSTLAGRWHHAGPHRAQLIARGHLCPRGTQEACMARGRTLTSMAPAEVASWTCTSPSSVHSRAAQEARPGPELRPSVQQPRTPGLQPSSVQSPRFIPTAPLKSASPSVRHTVQSTCLGPTLLPFVSRLDHFPLTWPILLSCGPVSLLQNGDNKGTWSKQLSFSWSSARSFTKWR